MEVKKLPCKSIILLPQQQAALGAPSWRTGCRRATRRARGVVRRPPGDGLLPPREGEGSTWTEGSSNIVLQYSSTAARYQQQHILLCVSMGATISLGFACFSIKILASKIRFFFHFFNVEINVWVTFSLSFDCVSIPIRVSIIHFSFFAYQRFCFRDYFILKLVWELVSRFVCRKNYIEDR